MLNQLVKLSRSTKQLIMLVFDSLMLVLILLAAFSIRLGYWFIPQDELIWVTFGVPIIALPIFVYFGLYRSVIRYIDFKALWMVFKAVTLYALLWSVAGFMASVGGIPRSVILINWLLSFFAIGGSRIVVSWLLTKNSYKTDINIILRWLNRGSSQININSSNKRKRALIYGAGDAGIQLVSALEYSKEYYPIGLIDDSRDLQGAEIRGLTVYALDVIEDIIKKLKVDDILIAMPSISNSKRLAIINKLEPYPVVVRILPGLAELAGGKVSVNNLREVNIKDLLGRNSVEPNKELLSSNITGKTVLITGAGGSIGSELSRQITSLKPKTLILYEINELALYSIEKELSNNANHEVNIYPILGSVQNRARLSNVLERFDVNTIYHSAAYKHVPMVEFNNIEGVENNIFGTLNCAEIAIQNGVETFVLISTDKAVRPTNTMGATKRSSELILQALSDKQNSTKFTMVRFGNVLGSSGSVVPLFTQQIKDGGPVTVTDENIIRYFMTISEAVELVIQAGTMGDGGDVFVLDMGDPVRIDDLAKKMIRLSGLQVKSESHPDGDIKIKYIGLRPGEKLYEELLISNNVSSTGNPQIMRAKENMIAWKELNLILNKLKIAVESYDQEKIRELLILAVPDFKPQSGISDILYKK